MDGRANRLADVFAKSAAQSLAVSPEAVALTKSAEAAAKHAFALLGAVTFAANNHVMSSVLNGKMVQRTVRDSCDAPPVRHGGKRASRPAETSTIAHKAIEEFTGCGATACNNNMLHAVQLQRSAAVAHHKRRAAAVDAAAETAAVNATLGRLSAPSGSSSGASRLAALRDRVLSRLSV